MAKTTDFQLGNSPFWIILLFLSVVGLGYLLVWANQNNNLQALVVAVIMLMFIIIGFIFSKFEVFSLGSWKESSISFTIGFVAWAIIGTLLGTQSILSLTENNVFSSISSQLPQLLEFLMTAIVIPIAEEMTWIVGIPFATIGFFNILAKNYGNKYPILRSKILLFVIMTLIAGTTFAYFHVSKQFFAFLISAFIFRAIMILGVYGAQWFTKTISLLPAFAVGAHIANNWANFGFARGMNLLFDNFVPLGAIVLLFLGSVFATALFAGIANIRGVKQ